jgi:hypothetical protein
MEDAWAAIASQSEQEGLEDTIDQGHNGITDERLSQT